MHDSIHAAALVTSFVDAVLTFCHSTLCCRPKHYIAAAGALSLSLCVLVLHLRGAKNSVSDFLLPGKKV